VPVVARTPDLELKRELLDQVVDYLAHHGIADVSLRPLADALNTSASRLVHHLGPKEQLLTQALRRATEIQEEVGAGWLRRHPDMTPAVWFRRWWRWINASPDNLALTRLGYEAAALDATVSGLPADVRADQIATWTRRAESLMVRSGVRADDAKREAVLAKALFTGLVLDLLASGDRTRLTTALEDGLAMLDARLAVLRERAVTTSDGAAAAVAPLTA
jgi:AcrR family transcriptional regulator